MFKQLEVDFGRIDILVNNAGTTTHPTSIDEINVGEWYKVIDVNVHGVFHCM